MSGPDNQFEALAAQAAKSLDEDRALVRQLSLLPDEQPGAQLVADGKGKRGQGKALNQMRDWLASKGYRLPEDVIAEIAGLASREDAVLTAIATTDRILAAAARRGRHRIWVPSEGWVEPEGPWQPTPSEWQATFMQVYAMQLRGAEALLPYGAPKVTPEQITTQQVNQIIVQAAPQTPPAGPAAARDVTPKARRIAPPPMPGQIVENQALSAEPVAPSDGEARTE